MYFNLPMDYEAIVKIYAQNINYGALCPLLMKGWDYNANDVQS